MSTAFESPHFQSSSWPISCLYLIYMLQFINILVYVRPLLFLFLLANVYSLGLNYTVKSLLQKSKLCQSDHQKSLIPLDVFRCEILNTLRTTGFQFVETAVHFGAYVILSIHNVWSDKLMELLYGFKLEMK